MPRWARNRPGIITRSHNQATLWYSGPDREGIWIWGKDGSQSDLGNRYGTDQNGPGSALMELVGPGCLREPVGEILTDWNIGIGRPVSQLLYLVPS